MFKKIDYVMMNCAKEMATLSKCVSKQVACLLVKEGRIISTGINGTPKGYKNCCDHFPMGITSYADRELHHAWSNVHEIHAELNAINAAARFGNEIDGCTAYVTLKPCIHCTKTLIGAGVKKIIYDVAYDKNGSDEPALNRLLEECGVDCQQLV